MEGRMQKVQQPHTSALLHPGEDKLYLEEGRVHAKRMKGAMGNASRGSMTRNYMHGLSTAITCHAWSCTQPHSLVGFVAAINLAPTRSWRLWTAPCLAWLTRQLTPCVALNTHMPP